MRRTALLAPAAPPGALTALLGLLATLLGALLLTVVGAGPAAAGDGQVGVRGTLRNGETPVPNVRISVTDPGGAPVGEARSGPDGSWTIPLPRIGTYSVSLDESTLPEGVTVREGQPTTREVALAVGQTRTVLFPLGAGTRQTTGRGEQALQLAAEGLRFGLVLALASVGLSLIFGTTGLTNFAHGELITLGALVAFVLNVTLGVQLIAAAVLTVVVCGLAGALLDRGFWRPLRRRGTGLIGMMIITIGLSIFVRYLYLYLFGGSTRAYADYVGQRGLDLGPISLAPADLVSMGLAAVVLVLSALALLRTRIGKATRAVADNPALAAASGIDVERVIQVVWVAGAALAGLSGVLLAINQQVNWQMGFQVLLLVFAAVTLGGLGTAFGALIGSLIVGLLLQLSVLVIPAELQNVGALAVLIVILLIRPQGILGRRERVG